jgi:signal peptidase I
MKKKLIITAAVLCTLIVGLLITARITGMLLIYKIPTLSNLPNVNLGDKVYSSNLKNPKLYNFITYTSLYSDSLNMTGVPDSKTNSTYLHRLCGMPDDVIEMKQGVLFVNNKNFDKEINLYNQYKISSTAFNLIEQVDVESIYAYGGVQMINNDSALVIFDSILLKKYASKIKLTQYIVPYTQNGIFIWNNKDKDWNTDNFGPLKIPVNRYFVLGDNRHNALDSRYIGFIKKENINGVVLNK